MSAASKEVMEQIDRALQRNVIPEWVGSLLGKTFFDKCPNHELQKNELNRYCITCNTPACRHCVKDDHHDAHKILTINRHVYQDVVPLDEMEKHIDCEKIQPYKCNKKWVLSLNPLRHSGSGSLTEVDGACNVCKRKLTDPEQFHFCSIACKVQAMSRETSIVQAPAPGVGTSRKSKEVQQPKNNFRKRSRKGVPRRAPLF